MMSRFPVKSLRLWIVHAQISRKCDSLGASRLIVAQLPRNSPVIGCLNPEPLTAQNAMFSEREMR